MISKIVCGAWVRGKEKVLVVGMTFILLMYAATVAADTGDDSDEGIIKEYSDKTRDLIKELRGFGYVVGFGLVIIGAIAYGISTLSSTLDPSQAIQGRAIGMRIIIVGLFIVAICAIAEDLVCHVAGFFGQSPEWCQT